MDELVFKMNEKVEKSGFDQMATMSKKKLRNVYHPCLEHKYRFILGVHVVNNYGRILRRCLMTKPFGLSLYIKNLKYIEKVQVQSNYTYINVKCTSIYHTKNKNKNK